MDKRISQYIKNRIKSGVAQFEDGQYMKLEESKDRINKEFFDKSLEEHIALGRQQIKEGKFSVINDSYFDDARAYIHNKYIDAGINEGIADIEAGRCMELRHDNIKEVLSKPLFEWVNDPPNEK